NAGTPGFTTAEVLITLATRIAPLKPDVVVVYEMWNDLKPAGAEGFLPDYSHWRRVPVQKGSLNAALDYSCLVRGVQTQIEKLLVRRPQRRDHVNEDGLNAFRSNLREIVAISRSWGAQVVLCTYPSMLSPRVPRATLEARGSVVAPVRGYPMWYYTL